MLFKIAKGNATNKFNYMHLSQYFEHVFTNINYLGGIHDNDLINVLDINDIENNEPHQIRRSSYDFHKFSKFAQRNTRCFSILSTNIQPIN